MAAKKCRYFAVFQGDPSGEAFIQLDSEEAAAMIAVSRHKRPMAFANKKRVIDVIQCSGDDMSFVLTSGMPHVPLQLPAVLPAPQIPPPSQITLQGQLLTPGNGISDNLLKSYRQNHHHHQDHQCPPQQHHHHLQHHYHEIIIIDIITNTIIILQQVLHRTSQSAHKTQLLASSWAPFTFMPKVSLRPCVHLNTD